MVREFGVKRGTIGDVLWLWVVIAIALLGAIAVVAAGQGESMHDVHEDRPDVLVPRHQRLAAKDIRSVRFSTGLRGYRMDEVDALLARVEAELAINSGEQERPDPPDAEASSNDDEDSAAHSEEQDQLADGDTGYPHT